MGERRLGADLAMVKPSNPAVKEVMRSTLEEYLEFWETRGPCEESRRNARTGRIMPHSVLKAPENQAFPVFVHNILAGGPKYVR